MTNLANSQNQQKKQLVDGIVEEALPGATFKVRLKDNSYVLAHIAGKLRVNFIKILLGDRVVIELSPYDSKRGRIIFRK